MAKEQAEASGLVLECTSGCKERANVSGTGIVYMACIIHNRDTTNTLVL